MPAAAATALVATAAALAVTVPAGADSAVVSYSGAPAPLASFNVTCDGGGAPPSGSGSGTATHVAGPDAPPLGVGSLHLQTGVSSTFVGVDQIFDGGIPGDDLTALTVKHYEVGNPSDGSATIELVMDRDGDGIHPDTLFSIAPGTFGSWETVDGLTASYFVNDAGSGTTYSDYMGAHANAELDGIYVGEVNCITADLSTNIDDLVIGLSGVSTTYDFEPQFPSAVSATASTSTTTAGHHVTLTGTLTSNGTPKAGQTLQLWAKTYPAASFHKVSSSTTNGSGVATSTQSPLVATRYEWRHPDGLYAAATSTGKSVGVRTALTENVADTTLTANQPLVLWGTTTPSHSGATMKLFRVAHGRGVRVMSTKVRSDGTYLFSHTLPRGTDVLFASIAAGHGNLANKTPRVTVHVS
jgi:hypothetical protein